MESNHFFPGLETGLLNISCSSVYALTHAVERCLINYKPREGSTGWGAAYNNLDQYIQFSSPIAYNFHKICTKGQGNWDCWVRSFVISYTLDGTLWINYNNSQILDANTDRNTIKVNDLVPFQARVVRIKPYTWYGHICMRVEMYISHNTSDSTDLRLNFNNYSLIPAIEIGMVVRASSIYDASHDLSRIRLNFSGSREGAMSWQAGFNNLNQWVLVSTLVPKKWYKVSTQGGNNREQWVEKYYLSYTVDGREWYLYENGKIFKANWDKDSIVSLDLKPFTATSIRIHPTAWNNCISMRLEMYFRDA